MDISKVRIPSGTVLNIKDATARTRLSQLTNVENKNVATIKGEILTSANVKSALGTGTNNGTFLAKDGTWKVPVGDSNVQSNWNETDSTSDAYIKNKPSLATVATSGSYNDLTNKPTITTPIQSDWNQSNSSALDYIKNKPAISAGTAALLTAGTDTSNKTWTAKILHDYISYPNVIYTVYAPSATSGAISLNFNNGPVQVITLSGNASSVSTSNIPAGHSLHVIFKSSDASTSYTVAIAHNATTSNCPAGSALSLTVPGNSAGYTEVDFLNVNNVIYVRGV